MPTAITQADREQPAAAPTVPATTVVSSTDNNVEAEAPAQPATGTVSTAPVSNAERPEPFKLKDNYQSRTLTLAYPSSENWGVITLVDQDAQMLFDSMRVQIEQVGGDATWKPDLAKRGQRMECVQRTAQSGAKGYVCTFLLEYRAGQVLAVKKPGTPDDTAGSGPSNDYTSANLVLDAGTRRASVLLTGDDARAIYYTMKNGAQSIVPADGSFAFIATKKTDDLTCSESAHKGEPSRADYACEFKFSYWNGSAL